MVNGLGSFRLKRRSQFFINQPLLLRKKNAIRQAQTDAFQTSPQSTGRNPVFAGHLLAGFRRLNQMVESIGVFISMCIFVHKREVVQVMGVSEEWIVTYSLASI
jgi:hypothetical protein